MMVGMKHCYQYWNTSCFCRIHIDARVTMHGAQRNYHPDTLWQTTSLQWRKLCYMNCFVDDLLLSKFYGVPI